MRSMFWWQRWDSLGPSLNSHKSLRVGMVCNEVVGVAVQVVPVPALLSRCSTHVPPPAPVSLFELDVLLVVTMVEDEMTSQVVVFADSDDLQVV